MCLCPSISYEDATAVVTMGEGKFYSLGLDLNLMATMSLLELLQFSNDLQKLLARLLTFPLVTVAAINGKLLYSLTYNHFCSVRIVCTTIIIITTLMEDNVKGEIGIVTLLLRCLANQPYSLMPSMSLVYFYIFPCTALCVPGVHKRRSWAPVYTNCPSC